MLIIYLCGVTLLLVAVAGGDLRQLAYIHFVRMWLVWAALLIQVIAISVLPASHPEALAVAHVTSYVAAGVCFVANRRVPGMWLSGLGGAVNGVVIAINGGTLPASPDALRRSGWTPRIDHFNNSAVLSHPRLSFLGDIFATPRWLPGHNVFSIGDILIVSGVVWFLVAVCRPTMWLASRQQATSPRRTVH